MKQVIIVLIVMISFSMAFSQELTESHINKVDHEGRKQGIWKVYDGTGNLKYRGEYLNGKPVGEFKYYYSNGRVKAVLIHRDNGRETYSTHFHPNGKMMAQGKYAGQVKDSTWLYYNEEDGALSAEEHYLNSRKEGIWKTYYPEGQVTEEITYRDDAKDGPWQQYFTDGSIKLKASYVEDKLEGLYVIYHLNGNVEISGTFLNGQKHSSWVYLDDKGVLEKREEYDHGRLLKPPAEEE